MTKLQESFTRLVMYHLRTCQKPHVGESHTIGVCVPCEEFECKVCGAKEAFDHSIVDIQDGGGNEWACAIITQGDAFAEKHKHVQ